MRGVVGSDKRGEGWLRGISNDPGLNMIRHFPTVHVIFIPRHTEIIHDRIGIIGLTIRPYYSYLLGITATMPPQQARSITSYFNKVPSTSPTSVAKSVTTATTSSNGTAITTSSTTTQTSPAQSSPSVGQKRSFLSDAARKAIEDGAAEASTAKKAKPNGSELSYHLDYFVNTSADEQKSRMFSSPPSTLQRSLYPSVRAGKSLQLHCPDLKL